MGHSKGSPEREVHSDTGLPKKINKNINNLTLCPQEIKEQQERHLRASRRMEIINITAEFNDIETKSAILRINESRSWFFQKIKKTDKLLSRLFMKKRERTQRNTIRNDRGETTTDTTEIKGL